MRQSGYTARIPRVPAWSISRSAASMIAAGGRVRERPTQLGCYVEGHPEFRADAAGELIRALAARGSARSGPRSDRAEDRLGRKRVLGESRAEGRECVLDRRDDARRRRDRAAL